MLHHTMHPEDIKAAIRKRYGSLAEFHRVHGLPKLATSEVLRGRKSKRTEECIERVLEQAGDESIAMDANPASAENHSLNQGAK